MTSMNKRTERANAEEVRRRLARALRASGFERTKTSLFIRPRPLWIEFIHLHKYSFGPSFRVHLGIRLLNDPFEAVALNGLDSHSEGWFILDYGASPESIVSCAEEIGRFCLQVGEPWFARWREPSQLLTSADSPLNDSEKGALEQALQGHADEGRISRSHQLLGTRHVP